MNDDSKEAYCARRSSNCADNSSGCSLSSTPRSTALALSGLFGNSADRKNCAWCVSGGKILIDRADLDAQIDRRLPRECVGTHDRDQPSQSCFASKLSNVRVTPD